MPKKTLELPRRKLRTIPHTGGMKTTYTPQELADIAAQMPTLPTGTITKKIAKTGPGAMTAKELAGLLSISTKTLYKMIKENRIPCMRIGDLVRFDRQITIEWIRARWS